MVLIEALDNLTRDRNINRQFWLFKDKSFQPESAQAQFPKDQPFSFTSKYEILRGDLAEILYNSTKNTAQYIFDESIDGIADQENSVTVKFASGDSKSYDLVIAADGVSSATRSIIVKQGNPYKYLGVYTSYATIPKDSTDDKWARWHNAVDGKVILLRPDNKGTARLSVNFWDSDPEEKHYSQPEAVEKIREVLSNVKWKHDRIYKHIADDPELYLGPVSQVRLKRWSNGRCALVGDAAYCPTPFTGMGTTLAIIGSYILAGEIASHDDHRKAFTAYEEKFRKFVEDIQRVYPGQFRVVYPKSKTAS